MRFTVEIPDELLRAKPSEVSAADPAAPAHYTGTDAQSVGAAPTMGGGIALGLTPDHDALSAGAAAESSVAGIPQRSGGAAIDGGAAPK
jgi:hypothetical protein